jgi:hypothetical protein
LTKVFHLLDFSDLFIFVIVLVGFEDGALLLESWWLFGELDTVDVFNTLERDLVRTDGADPDEKEG